MGHDELLPIILEQEVSTTHNSYFHTAVLMGNKDVELYFRINNVWGEETLPKICENRSQEEAIRRLLFFDRIDTAYNGGLEILGITPPFDFRLTFDRSSTERKKALFQELYGTTQERTIDPEDLKQKLEYAIQVGIHQEKIVLPGIRPGITVHSGEFIKGLCQEYGVPIPEPK